MAATPPSTPRARTLSDRVHRLPCEVPAGTQLADEHGGIPPGEEDGGPGIDNEDRRFAVGPFSGGTMAHRPLSGSPGSPTLGAWRSTSGEV